MVGCRCCGCALCAFLVLEGAGEGAPPDNGKTLNEEKYRTRSSCPPWTQCTVLQPSMHWCIALVVYVWGKNGSHLRCAASSSSAVCYSTGRRAGTGHSNHLPISGARYPRSNTVLVVHAKEETGGNGQRTSTRGGASRSIGLPLPSEVLYDVFVLLGKLRA